MYYDYFGFNQPPFKITPDTSLFYPGGDRGAILDALTYAILNGEGIVKVVGEVGSGKTMLCRMLEKELPERVEVVYLVNPSIAPENTLHAIAFELKLGIQSTTSRFEVMNELQQYLLERHSQNRQVVVFVEEAQSMPIATLEEIRLLSNLETQQSKLLQIVLFGQPELDVMIASPEIRQLKERITYSFQLAPFKINDIREYINSRVRACGYRAGELFSDAAVKHIEHYSRGLLRRINILADKSLLAAFADNSHTVSARHARLAVRDSEFVPRTNWAKRSLVYSIVAVLLAVLAVTYGQLYYRTVQLAPVDADTTGAGPTVPEHSPIPPVRVDPILPSVDIESQAVGASGDEYSPLLSANPAEPGFTGEAANISNIQEISLDTGRATGQADGITTQPSEVTSDDVTSNLKIEEVHSNSPLISEIDPILPATVITGSFQSSAETPSIKTQPMYTLQNFSNSVLGHGQEVDLAEQLLSLPPESVGIGDSVPETEVCQRCWSIIYRPVAIRKNL